MPKAQLIELYAQGLGVIEEARLEFGAGFNVLTGETGAGKTLLLGSLGLALGGDAGDARYALGSETRAVALFLREPSEELAFVRETSTSGRLKSSLNGAPSSVEALRALAEELITIHGQHDSLALKSRVETLRLIDEHGTVDTTELDALRDRLREARSLRDGYGGDSGAREREIDFLLFQIRELDETAILSSSELADTLEELTRITALRDGQEALGATLQAFDGDSDESVLATYARALSLLPSGDAYESVREGLNSALIQARDALSDLAALGNAESIDEATIEQLEHRADVLQSIARKYGGSLESALESASTLKERYKSLTSEAGRLEGLDQEIQGLEGEEAVLARRVRAEREFAATQLTNAVREQLARVALPHASLRFIVDGDDGSDASIFFTPNPGQAEGPLSSLASGGELSRVLLAISLETADENVVAVFDEVDAGLGGQVAQQIGECLWEVGQRQQVLAVTHLASVAAKADHHFVIEKSVEGGSTRTIVRVVTGDDRVREIARMLAGDEVSDASRALATQLLEKTSQVRAAPDFSR